MKRILPLIVLFSSLCGADAQNSIATFTTDFTAGAVAGVDRASFTNLNTGWAYLWNAPSGWATNGLSGDGTSAPVGVASNYVPLVWAGGTLGWTADGDQTNANNQPSGFLRLAGGGTGHPGLGSAQTGNVGNTLDRCVIAAYEIQAADGADNYRITNSTIAGTTISGTPLRVLIHVNDNVPVFNATFAKDGVARAFDASLGFLNVGDRVFVCVGPDGNAGSDSFTSFNFSIGRITTNTISPAPLPPPPGGSPVAVEVINPGAEINGGIDRQLVNDPAVPGWDSVGTAQVGLYSTGPNGGRWRYIIEDSAVMYQLTGHAIASNHAYALRFDASSFSGLPPTMTADFFVDDGAGGRTLVASREFTFNPVATADWQAFELIAYFGALNAHAGKQLGIQFRGPASGSSRYFSVDSVTLTDYDGVIEPPSFHATWTNAADRLWAGPEFWANRLQDWAVTNGWLECVSASSTLPLRTVHLLTRRLNAAPANFSMRVYAAVASTNPPPSGAMAGFLIGAGQSLDYRGAALVFHSGGKDGGLMAGVDGLGRATVRDNAQTNQPTLITGGVPASPTNEVEIEVSVTCLGSLYRLDVRVFPANGTNILSEATLYPVEPARLIGNVALISHAGSSTTRYKFRDWQAGGAKFDADDTRNFGPLVSAQHTLSRNVLKMTAQLAPVATSEVSSVSLQINTNGSWQTIAARAVNPDGFVATFRVPGWNSGSPAPYRLETTFRDWAGLVQTQRWAGTIRADPVDKETIVLAAFSCQISVANSFFGVASAANPIAWTAQHIAHPHTEVFEHAAAHQPDLLFFSGDQVYEGGNPTGADTGHLGQDYLFKWYLWCLSSRELTRDIPSISIPDDHDVYQGNLWGQGGRAIAAQENGGYTRPASFVKMVERTQTSHLPDPFDPTPVEQGIGVYYCALKYGRIGFAVVEDRKFKHGMEGLPARSPGDPNYDTDQLNIPGKELLGPRQELFLQTWGQDWQGEDMKAVLSQTVWAAVNTHGSEAFSRHYFDMDSGGWPQLKRDLAVDLLRRAFAVHVTGDQHVATVVHHGIAAHDDSGFAFCVPAVCNAFPRTWDPLNTSSGTTTVIRNYKGQWTDGFKHPITVHAVANPAIYYATSLNVPPAIVHDRAPGYGIVRFNKTTRAIMMECWPRYADPNDPSTGGQYPDWPITIRQTDNYARAPWGWLPVVGRNDLPNAVVQVADQSSGEVLYTLRTAGTRFRPHVFTNGTYVVRLSEPDTGALFVLSNQVPSMNATHRINEFWSDNPYVVSNTTAWLNWNIEGSLGVSITPFPGNVTSNSFNGIGRVAVIVSSNTVFTLFSTNLAGQTLQTQMEVLVFENRESWRARYFAPVELASPALELTLWGDSADPDGDGLINFIEFALTTNPRADSRANLPRASILPYVVSGTNDLFLTLTYKGVLNGAGVWYEVQYSDDLQLWHALSDYHPVPVSTIGVVPGETPVHTERDQSPISSYAQPVLFLRLVLKAP